MMIKKILTVYLAGRIDGLSKEEASDWREEAIKKLQAKGFVGVSPISHGLDLKVKSPLKRDQDRCSEIFQTDCDLVYRCDAVLANLSVDSIGTAQEIFYANQILNEPVFGYNYKNDSAFMFVTVDELYNDIDEAIEGMIKYNQSLSAWPQKYKLPPERLKPRNA